MRAKPPDPALYSWSAKKSKVIAFTMLAFVIHMADTSYGAGIVILSSKYRI